MHIHAPLEKGKSKKTQADHTRKYSHKEEERGRKSEGGRGRVIYVPVLQRPQCQLVDPLDIKRANLDLLDVNRTDVFDALSLSPLSNSFSFSIGCFLLLCSRWPWSHVACK